jgi:thiol-disulfide isomerase/thioredoxin
MRRIISSLAALMLVSHAAVAASSKVGDAFMLLSREARGWRVESVAVGATGKILKRNDLILRIDGRDAAGLGPLALRLEFAAASDTAMPALLERDGKMLPFVLWLADGAPPPQRTDPTATKDVSSSELAPDFALPSLAGSVASLWALRGKWVVVSFWATWCAPCMLEEPVLDRLAKAYRGRLVVLALALKETHASLEAFTKKFAPAYTVVDAGSLKGPIPRMYGVTRPGASTVPVNVLVRPDGTIAYVQSGYQEPSPLEARVREALDGH